MVFSSIDQSPVGATGGINQGGTSKFSAPPTLQGQVSELLTLIQPRHQNAAKALYRSPMREVNLSTSIFFEKIKAAHGFSKPTALNAALPRLLKNKAYHQSNNNLQALFYVADRVAFYVNQTQITSLNPLNIKKMVTAHTSLT